MLTNPNTKLSRNLQLYLSYPLIFIDPELKFTTPQIELINVDLPETLLPKMPMRSFLAIFRFRLTIILRSKYKKLSVSCFVFILLGKVYI